jgi:predicted O-methyltransferase YrrM
MAATPARRLPYDGSRERAETTKSCVGHRRRGGYLDHMDRTSHAKRGALGAGTNPIHVVLRIWLSSITIVLSVGLALSSYAEDAQNTEDGRDSRYTFSKDWFSDNIATWERFLEPYRGRAGLNYLEVGVFEGRATVWMAENILTHPTSRLTALDVFPGDLKQRFLANLQASGFGGEVTTLVGFSQQTLRQLEPDSFDIIYIDGSHQADDVLVDVVLSWSLLRQRGMLIFDDYQWKPELPPELRPRPAIDAFVTMFRREVEVVSRGYQLMLRKHRKPCQKFASRCTLFGSHLYFWDDRTLVHSGKPLHPIELTDEELDMIESLSRGARHGEAGVYVPNQLIRSAKFIGLRKKLRLRIEDQVIVWDVATLR